MRIIQVASDPTTGAADLLEVVEYDAAMAARIMRSVNSSYYSMQNKVADLKLAITLLGFKEIRNLAMTAYVAQLFKKGKGYGTYSREFPRRSLESHDRRRHCRPARCRSQP